MIWGRTTCKPYTVETKTFEFSLGTERKMSMFIPVLQSFLGKHQIPALWCNNNPILYSFYTERLIHYHWIISGMMLNLHLQSSLYKHAQRKQKISLAWESQRCRWVYEAEETRPIWLMHQIKQWTKANLLKANKKSEQEVAEMEIESSGDCFGT